MRSAIACIAFLTALIPAQARADWEFTRWGMSPDEVARASNGDVTVLAADKRLRVAEANLESAAEGTHGAGPLRLQVRFSFDLKTGGLACVSYAVEEKGQNTLLKETMVQRYGPPQTVSSLPAIGLQSLGWHTPADSITLELMDEGPAFVLQCAKN